MDDSIWRVLFPGALSPAGRSRQVFLSPYACKTSSLLTCPGATVSLLIVVDDHNHDNGDNLHNIPDRRCCGFFHLVLLSF